MRKIWLLFAITMIALQMQAQKKQNSTLNEDSIYFSSVKYRSIGPYRGGRSAAVAGDLQQKNT